VKTAEIKRPIARLFKKNSSLVDTQPWRLSPSFDKDSSRHVHVAWHLRGARELLAQVLDYASPYERKPLSKSGPQVTAPGSPSVGV